MFFIFLKHLIWRIVIVDNIVIIIILYTKTSILFLVCDEKFTLK